MEMVTVAYGAEILTFELPQPEPEEGEQPADDDEDNQDEEAQAYLMSATYMGLSRRDCHLPHKLKQINI